MNGLERVDKLNYIQAGDHADRTALMHLFMFSPICCVCMTFF